MGVRSWPLHGKDIRKWSQGTRQGRLQALVSRFDCPVLLHSEAFGDGETLVRVAEKHELEGVVSNAGMRAISFTSGKACSRQTAVERIVCHWPG